MSFQSRVVVITGGGTGIGKAIAGTFARNQAQVVIVGRRSEALQATAQEVGPNCNWQQADVSQRNQVAAAVKAIVDQFGQIDVLVNNAGFVRGITTDLPLDQAEQVWDDEIGTNLKGAFLMSVAIAPHLPRPGGRIINISSIAAFTGGSRPGPLATPPPNRAC
jgi:3-oxoacyl-[acyl-carrier protein] reductase